MVMHNPFLKRFREFILAPSHSRTISAVVILIIAAAVPLTVLVAQQQQQTQQHAATAVQCSNPSTGATWTCSASICQGCYFSTGRCGTSGCFYDQQYKSNTCGAGCVPTPAPSSSSAPSPSTSANPTSTAAPTPTPAGGSVNNCPTTNPTWYCPHSKCVNISTGSCSTNAGGTGGTCVTGTWYASNRCGTSGCWYDAAGYQSTSCGYIAPTPTPTINPSATPTSTPIAGDTCTTTPGNLCTTATTGCSASLNLAPATGTCPAAGQTCCKPTTTGTLPAPVPNTANSFTRILGPANQCVVFTTFSWASIGNASGYEIRYTEPGTAITWGPYKTGQTNPTSPYSSTMITTPFIANTTNNGFLHPQCTRTEQNQTGYSCGFADNETGTWYVATLDSAGNATWSAPQSYTTASCATPPVCQAPVANPSPVNVNSTSNLSITCSNTTANTTYAWTSNTCGTITGSASTSPTTWTAPSAGPTSCPVSVQVCNGPGKCVTGTVTIPVTIPYCNGNIAPVGTCVASQSNTCGVNNGVQGWTYTTYNGSAVCQPSNINLPCTVNNCDVGNVCTNGVCTTPAPTATASPSPTASASPSPTATPACSGSTPNLCNGVCTNTQTDNNNCGVCGNACASGQVCSNGTCTTSCTAPNVNCNGTCVNTQTSNSNCGVCGNACASGQVCTNGTCVNTCTAPNTTCNGVCTNTQTDNNNCGVCGNACTAGQVCTNGTCGLIPGHTYIALRIGMDAIGSAGDNENPNPSSSNQTPGQTTRNLTVQIFDSNNSQVFAQVGSINYNSTSGVFLGTVDLGANFANGNYTVKVKSDGHLKRLIPGIQNLSSSLTQPIQLPGVNLVAGDVDSNNALNINDYNILLSCVSSPFIANIDNHALCNSNANYIKLSDLEDNGVVNEFDYNLFLREYAVQNGD